MQIYSIEIWQPCFFSTKIWTSINSNENYIFGIGKHHILTPSTQIPSQIPSPTQKPFKDPVPLSLISSHGRCLPNICCRLQLLLFICTCSLSCISFVILVTCLLLDVCVCSKK